MKWKLGLGRLLLSKEKVVKMCVGIILTKLNFKNKFAKLDGDGIDDEDYQPAKEYVEPSLSHKNSKKKERLSKQEKLPA